MQSAIEPTPDHPDSVATSAGREPTLYPHRVPLQRPKPVVGERRPAWLPWVVAIVVTICYVIGTTDLEARARWNTFGEDLVDDLTERVEGGQASRQLGFLMLGVTGVALCAMPTQRRLRPDVRLLYPLILFVSWAVISIAWSTDRPMTAKRLVVFACVASLIAGFWRHLRAKDLALLALVGSGFVTVIGIIYEGIAGDVVGEHGVYRFCGTMHPNHQGINAVLLMLSSLAFFDRTKLRRFLLLAAFAFFILLLTKSRTALIAGVVATMLFGVLRLPARWTIGLGVGGACLVGVVLLLNMTGLSGGLLDVLEMGRTDSDATTLTGRTDIWKYAFALMDSDPTRWMTGFAYQSFWTPENTRYISEGVYFHISEGHSAYFDTLLETGFVGLGIYIVLLYGSLAKWTYLSFRNNNGALAFLAAILAFAAVHGLTESTTVAPNFPTFFSQSAIAAAALFSVRVKPAEESFE
jgi:O-antigen ligase